MIWKTNSENSNKNAKKMRYTAAVVYVTASNCGEVTSNNSSEVESIAAIPSVENKVHVDPTSFAFRSWGNL